MKLINTKIGFTLIELLVVILVIGILTTVAVSQYQQAVERGRLTQAFSVIRELVPAMDTYYLQHGSYPTRFDQLDIKIPWTGHVKPYHLTNDWRSNQDWGLYLFNYPADYGTSIGITRISGPYAGTSITFQFKNNDLPIRTWLCQEFTFTYKLGGDVRNFSGKTGDYCQKILKGSPVPGNESYYTFPVSHH